MIYAFLLIVAVLILSVKLFAISRQNRVLLSQGKQASFALRRLRILFGRECIDFFAFACVLLLLASGNYQFGLIENALTVTFLSVVYAVVRWAIYDLRIWLASKHAGLNSQTFSHYIYDASQALGKFCAWMVPSIFMAFIVLEHESVYLLPILFFLLNWGAMVILPLMKIRLFSELKTVKAELTRSVQVFEDCNPVVSKTANARSLGGFHAPFIVYTAGLKQLLEDKEFKAVLAHEIGHIVNHHHIKWVLYRTLMHSLFCMVLYVVGLNDLTTVLIAVMGYRIGDSLFAIVSNKILHHFEFEADREAVKQHGSQTFKAALNKIWSLNQTPLLDDVVFARLYNTHPTPQQRLSLL